MNPERIAEINADAKLVYKIDGTKLIALADKYGATSKGLSYSRRNVSDIPEVVHATGSKNATAELRRNVYRAIKELMTS